MEFTTKFNIDDRVTVIIDSELREESIMEINVAKHDRKGYTLNYIVSNGAKVSPRFVVDEYHIAPILK